MNGSAGENTPADSGTTELNQYECWKLLRTSSVARLAVVVGESPEIFPVNYISDEGSLVFRTGPGAKLAAILGGGPLALEADGLNTYGTIAWSVVVKGTAEEVRDVDDVPAYLPVPWEGGAKEHLIRIMPGSVTGRRFMIDAPGGPWWPPAVDGPGKVGGPRKRTLASQGGEDAGMVG